MKKKILIAALSLLLLTQVTAVAFAADQTVTAKQLGNVIYQIDSQQVTPGGDGLPLMYNNRMYVPIRLISENMGATVGWEQDTRVLMVSSKPATVVTAAAVQVTSSAIVAPPCVQTTGSGVTVPAISSFALPPVRYTSADYEISVTNCFKDQNYFYVNLNFKNKADNDQIKFQIEQSKCYLVINGNSYYLKDTPSGVWSQKWYNDILRDNSDNGGSNGEQNGYLTFKNPPKSDLTGNMEVHIFVLQNDSAQKESEITIPVLLQNVPDSTPTNN